VRVIPQKDLKGLQFLDDTLDDIEFVSCNDDFLAFVQRAEGSDFGCDPRSETIREEITSVLRDLTRGSREYVHILADAIRVYTDTAVENLGDLSGHVDSALNILVSTNTNARRSKMTTIGELLEHDQVCPEHSIDDFFASYEAAVIRNWASRGFLGTH